MKGSPKYQAAAGSADDRARQADFCAEVKAKEAEIRAAKRDMDAGRPASVDPQAETLALLTRLKVEQVSTALAVAVAVVMELVSSLGFFAVAHAAPLPIGSAPVCANVEAVSAPAASVMQLTPIADTDISAVASALASLPRPSRRKKRPDAALPPPSAAAPVPRKRSRVKV